MADTPDFFVKSGGDVPDFFVKPGRSRSSSRDKEFNRNVAIGLANPETRPKVQAALAPEPLNLFQRLLHGLGAFNSGEAAARGMDVRDKGGSFGDGLVTALSEYPKTVAAGLGAALTGDGSTDVSSKRGPKGNALGRRQWTDEMEERVPHFADKLAAEYAGRGGAIGRGIDAGLDSLTKAESLGRYMAGVGLDVATDPSTYVAEPAVKYAAKGLGAIGGTALKGAAVLAPELTEEAVAGAKKLKDAVGAMMVHGYGVSPEVVDASVEHTSALSQAKEGVETSNYDRLGRTRGAGRTKQAVLKFFGKKAGGRLTAEQQAEVFEKMLAAKRVEEGGRARSAAKLAQLDNPVEAVQAELPGTQAPPELQQPGLPGTEMEKPVGGTGAVPEYPEIADLAEQWQATGDLDKARQLVLAAEKIKPGQGALPLDMVERIKQAQDLLERNPNAEMLNTRVRDVEPAAADERHTQLEMFEPPPEYKQGTLPGAPMQQPDPRLPYSGGLIEGTDLPVGTGAPSLPDAHVAHEALTPEAEKARQLPLGDAVPPYEGQGALPDVNSSVHNLADQAASIQNRAARNTRAESLSARTRTPEQMAELQAQSARDIAAGHIKDSKLAAAEAARSADPVVQRTIEEQVARNKKFAKAAGIENPYDYYIPGVENGEGERKIARFLESTRGAKVGPEGYKKVFRNLLADEDMVRHLPEAFSRREFEMVKDQMTRGMLRHAVNEAGVPVEAATKFKTAEAAAAAGFEPAMDGGRVVGYTKKGATEGLVPVREKGMVGGIVGYLKPEDKAFLDEMSAPKSKLFQHIDTIAKGTGFDATMSLFKRSVTSLFPAFHVRNWASGVLQNFEVLGKDALNPRNILDGGRLTYYLSKGGDGAGKGLITLAGGKQASIKSVLKPFAKRFEGSSQYLVDFAEATKADTAETTGELLRGIRDADTVAGKAKGVLKVAGKGVSEVGAATLGANAPHFRGTRAVGNFIETQQKMTAYLTALRQGKTTKEALTLAEKAGFDYRRMTQFESTVMKRIFPFYSYTRKNLPLQVKTMLTHPQRINAQNQMFSNADVLTGQHAAPGEREQLPDYMKSGYAVKWKNAKDGTPQYVSSFGTGLEQATDLLDTTRGLKGIGTKVISMTNPYLKGTFEGVTGIDSFRQKPLDTVVDAKEYALAPQALKNFLEIREHHLPIWKDGKKTDETRTEYHANPTKLNALRALPSSRLFTTMAQFFDGNIDEATRWTKLLTGVKPQPVDFEAEAARRHRETAKQIEDIDLGEHLIDRFTRTVVPKKHR